MRLSVEQLIPGYALFMGLRKEKKGNMRSQFLVDVGYQGKG